MEHRAPPDDQPAGNFNQDPSGPNLPHKGMMERLAEWLWQAMFAGIAVLVALHFLSDPERATQNEDGPAPRPQWVDIDLHAPNTYYPKDGSAVGCRTIKDLEAFFQIPTMRRHAVETFDFLMGNGICRAVLDAAHVWEAYDWDLSARSPDGKYFRLCEHKQGPRDCLYFRADDMRFVTAPLP
ncbi:MAG: hypothetical protein IRZ07_28780 [Microbispora sp.]|nr:hypothetical protein [Microbispora sp.]